MAHANFGAPPWCIQHGRFGDCLTAFNKAKKLEIYLFEDFDYDDNSELASLLTELTKSPFHRVSLFNKVPLLHFSADMKDVILGYRCRRLELERNGASWMKSFCDEPEF